MPARRQTAARADSAEAVLARERNYYQRFYDGFGQQHLARPAVRAFRAHLVAHILQRTNAGPTARILSLGCGIGDSEIPLAAAVQEVVGIDFSSTAVQQAQHDADRAGVRNVRFLEGTLESFAFQPGSFDVVVAIFLLHHLPEEMLEALPARVERLLTPGGKFYSLDPSRYRLSGAVGRLVVPHLMRQFRTPDERELDRSQTVELFERAGFDCQSGFYDFLSTPLAGLFPDWRAGYRFSRWADGWLVRIPWLRSLGSNFELVATKLA